MSVEANEEIGVSLRRWRKMRRLAANTVAAQTGIHKATLARWELGTHLPGIPELEALLDVLGVSAQERIDILSRLSAPRAVRRLRTESYDSSAMPVGGDLLRALRIRKGMNQAETARATGATQSQVAKWERSEAWPDATRLHTLCWILGASSEEVAALTQGRYRLPIDASPTVPDDEHYWLSRVRGTLDVAPGDMLDLFFLSLETLLWDRRDKPFGLPLLSLAYANHARAHIFYVRPERARMWAQRALTVTKNHRHDSDEWAAAVIAIGACFAAAKQPSSLHKAIASMEEWLPFVRHSSYRAWVMSDLSFYYARMGNADAAMQRNTQAMEKARGNIIEELFRQRDHAKVLMLLGRYNEALDVLHAGEALTKEGHDASARHRIMEAECLIRLESIPAATERLNQAHRHIIAEGHLHLLPQYNELCSQL